MLIIYHNPRCSKSREGLCFLEDVKQTFTIRKYLDKPFTKEELIDIIQKLAINPIELVRTKEAIWKENCANKKLNDSEIIEVLLQHPKLIERPIIVNGNKAVIARPTEKINEIL